MGAYYVTMDAPGNMSKKEVIELFESAQDADRYENGHSYSGGFGMTTGLKFMELTFPSTDKADDFLTEHAQKWEDAIAVRVTTKSGDVVWYIGAWCAS